MQRRQCSDPQVCFLPNYFLMLLMQEHLFKSKDMVRFDW